LHGNGNEESKWPVEVVRMMRWDEAMGLWETDLRSRRLSPETVRTWRSYLRRWGRWCAVNGVDPVQAGHRDVKAWIAEQSWSASSHKSARMALGSMYRLLVAEKVVKRKRNPMLGIAPVRQVPGTARPASHAQVAAGLDVRDEDTALMVLVLARLGLRCAEAVALRREDLDADGRGVTVRGKGDRSRWLPIEDPALRRALLERGPGWVFPGRFTGHLHPCTLRRRVKAATGCAPHEVRHWFASTVHDGTGDLLAVQRLLGHASPATTQIYVGVPRQRLRAAAGHVVPAPRSALLVAA
jgi:site-specific recombinase XerD